MFRVLDSFRIVLPSADSFRLPNAYIFIAAQHLATPGSESGDSDDDKIANWNSSKEQPQHVVVIGAGWGGLSSAYWLAKQQDSAVKITVVDAAPRVGGLVRDGYRSMTGERKAEAGQHGKTPWN